MKTYPIALFILVSACGSAQPASHTVSITQDSTCGTCASSQEAEGLAFELRDGRLALFVDFPTDDGHVAMLEVVGIGGANRDLEVKYHEVDGGEIVFDGTIEHGSYALDRIASEQSWVHGTMSFDAVDRSGARRVFRQIKIEPTGPSDQGGSYGQGGQGGVEVSGSTEVVVVVDPYDSGCGGYHNYDYDGGCGGSSGYDSSSGGGCEGDSASSSSGGGCEGDTAAASDCQVTSGASRGPMAASMLRLLWPIFAVAMWNRRARRRSNQERRTTTLPVSTS